MTKSYVTKSLRTRFSTFGFLSLFTFVLVFFLLTQNVYSLNVTLAWDPNSEEDLAGYRIFYCEENQGYNYEEPVWEGSETTCTIYNLDDNTTYYFVVRAFDTWGSESGDSNEACHAPPANEPPPGIVAIGEVIVDRNWVEIGEVIVDHNWKWVEFNDSFIDPVVVAKSLSCKEDEPAVVRIGYVDATGFEIHVQEWDYLDGIHADETVGYMVMERGTYTLPDGTMVEAGTFDADVTGTFGRVDFSQTFNQVPVVATTVLSFNEEDAVCCRLRNIDTTGFDFCMQEQELNSQIHDTETISYIAWEPSSGTVGDLTFEVEKTDDVITHDLQSIVYNESFMNPPVFFADMQTTNGWNTANLRWQDKDFCGIDVKIAEEQSLDSETYHTTEVVGYMVFSKIDNRHGYRWRWRWING